MIFMGLGGDQVGCLVTLFSFVMGVCGVLCLMCSTVFIVRKGYCDG